eukprot:gene9234-10196_t
MMTPSHHYHASSSQELKIVTFNILAPCYKKVTGGGLTGCEGDWPDLFLSRNEAICQALLDSQADLICLQEFWFSNPLLRDLYQKNLCGVGKGYEMRYLGRTSSGSQLRKDGLAVFVKKDRLLIEDVQEILFRDCGDRVALMLLLNLLPHGERPPQRFICVNTHLLFPHNVNATRISLREMTKVLGFVENYKQSQGYTSAFEQYCAEASDDSTCRIFGDWEGETLDGEEDFFVHPVNDCDPADVADEGAGGGGGGGPSYRWNRWVSHRNHLGGKVGVDHVFFLNPSRQQSHLLPPLPDWTNLVYAELLQRIVCKFAPPEISQTLQHCLTPKRPWTPTTLPANTTEEAAAQSLDQRHQSSKIVAGTTMTTDHLVASLRDAFLDFDQDHSGFVCGKEFAQGVAKLGFLGEASAELTPAEIQILLKSADRNEDGLLSMEEFVDRFCMAARMAPDPTISYQDVSFPALWTTLPSPSQLIRNVSRSLVEVYAPPPPTDLARRSLLLEEQDDEWEESNNSTSPSNRNENDNDSHNNRVYSYEGLDAEYEEMLDHLAQTKRFYFARSDFLRNTTTTTTNTTTTPSSPANNYNETAASGRERVEELMQKGLAVPMHDLRVLRMHLRPRMLEGGVWPPDYNLSDHGMLECTFLVPL